MLLYTAYISTVWQLHHANNMFLQQPRTWTGSGFDFIQAWQQWDQLELQKTRTCVNTVCNMQFDSYTKGFWIFQIRNLIYLFYFIFLKVALKVLSMSHLIQCNFASLLFNPNTKELIPERSITLVAANGRKPLSLVLESQKEWISTETQEVREDKNTRCQVDCFSVVSHPSEKRRKNNNNNNSGIVLFSLSPRTDRIAPVKAGRLLFFPLLWIISADQVSQPQIMNYVSPRWKKKKKSQCSHVGSKRQR